MRRNGLKHLSKNERAAISAYIAWLREKYEPEILRVILFGSKARGDAKQGSDVDLLIVLTNSHARTRRHPNNLGNLDPLWRDMVGTTFDFLMEYNVDISPTIVAERDLNKWSPLMANVKAEGIILWTKNN